MPAPTNLTPPVATGTAIVGNSATCTDGTWDETVTIAKQWQRETAPSSGLYASIPGAVGSGYGFVGADVALRVRCAVTATAAGPPPPPPVDKWLSIQGQSGDIQATWPGGTPPFAYAVVQQPWASGDADWAVANTGLDCYCYTSIADILSGSPSSPGDGVSYNDCVANGWFVTGYSSGILGGSTPTYNASGHGFAGEYLANISDAGYINKFCSNMIAVCNAHGFKGIFIDNQGPNFAGYWYGAPVPEAAWTSATLTAIQSITTQFHAAGLKVIVNANTYPSSLYSDDGAGDRTWANDLVAKGIDGLETEFWLFRADGYLYAAYSAISGWLGIQTDLQTAGVMFMGHPGNGVSDGDPLGIPDDQRNRYALGAHRIHWDGSHATFTATTSDASVNPNFGYDIGTPVGAIGGVAVGGGFSRTYSGGGGYTAGLTLWNAGSSSQAFTLPAGNWTRQDGAIVSGVVTVPAWDAWFLNQ